MKIAYQKLTDTALEPRRMTEHASGFDLFADLKAAVELQPQGIMAVPTGIAIEIPAGCEAQIRPRSGLAIKHGLGILNSPGTIDADYRGEIKVIIINLGSLPFCIEPQMRIAQMVICPVLIPELELQPYLAPSNRQDGGFGHTGH